MGTGKPAYPWRPMGRRDITWEGFYNARDLGGLPIRDGRVTRFGAFIRSADLRFVTPSGWQAARAAGVRTIIDLRNEDEVRTRGDGGGPTQAAGSEQLAAPRSEPVVRPGIERIEVPLDGIEDTEFWQHLNRKRLNGTPLYFRPFRDRRPDRCAAVITAMARTSPGGVLFHCGTGRDRTGLVSLLLLALVGVEPGAIADDYERSTARLPALFFALGAEDQGPAIERTLADRGTTARDAILDTLDGLDAELYLQSAGVASTELQDVRRRLVPEGR
jgi:protein-tyrosine phosphatase